MKKWLATVLVAGALSSPAAQSLDPITTEDTLKVQTATVLDLSEPSRVHARRLEACCPDRDGNPFPGVCLSQHLDEQGLLRVQAVFCLIEDDRDR